MANREHVAMVMRGADAWNMWRREREQHGIRPDLFGAELSAADLREANLSGASLSLADLLGANLFNANLIGASLTRANLSGADLRWANLFEAGLKGADLSNVNLVETCLVGANLCEANLRGSTLVGADLSGADLRGTQFEGAVFARSWLGNVDLSQAKGLDTATHRGPSTLGVDTIYRSKGKISEAFLRGAGVPEVFITFIGALPVGAMAFHSCFISYCGKDQGFAERLYADLQVKGVRCWYAPEDMKIGDEIRPRIDESIRVHDKLLIVLSRDSVRSSWVKKEVEAAFEREARDKRAVLFPIRLDNDVMETTEAWAADIRRTRHIGDFTGWENHQVYTKSFARLLRDLKADAIASSGR